MRERVMVTTAQDQRPKQPGPTSPVQPGTGPRQPHTILEPATGTVLTKVPITPIQNGAAPPATDMEILLQQEVETRLQEEEQARLEAEQQIQTEQDTDHNIDPEFDQIQLTQQDLNLMAQAGKQAQELGQIWLAHEARNIINHLIRIKRLPRFYFHEEAKKIGVPQDIHKNWRIRDWPYGHIDRDPRFREIVEVLYRVTLRLIKYPVHETYIEAIRRLRERVEYLKTLPGITHNQLSQHLRVSYKTLQELLQKEDGAKSRPRHCPWWMLERLENAHIELALDAHLNLQQAHPGVKDPVTGSELDILIDNTPYPEVRESQTVMEPMVQPGDRCWRCKAPWPNLTYDGPKPGEPNILVHICAICGRPSLTETPLIERYGPCGSCGAPWHNLKKSGTDQQGNGVHKCAHCQKPNLVAYGRSGYQRNRETIS